MKSILQSNRKVKTESAQEPTSSLRKSYSSGIINSRKYKLPKCSKFKVYCKFGIFLKLFCEHLKPFKKQKQKKQISSRGYEQPSELQYDNDNTDNTPLLC